MTGNAWFCVTLVNDHCLKIAHVRSKKSLQTLLRQEGRDYGGRLHSKYETDRL
jgi:hypothetical protein